MFLEIIAHLLFNLDMIWVWMFSATLHLEKAHHDCLEVWASSDLLEVHDLGTSHGSLFIALTFADAMKKSTFRLRGISAEPHISDHIYDSNQ